MKKLKKLDFILIVTIILAILSVSYPVSAWISASHRKAHVGTTEIDIPPLIYIRDDNVEEMTSFHLDGLQIETEYTFIFCVTPSMRNIVRSFSLGVIYTENIGMIIDIYPISSIDSTAGGGDFESRTLEDGNTYYFNYSASYGTSSTSWKTPKTTYGNDGSEDPTTEEENLNRGVHKVYSNLKFTSSDTWVKDTYYEELTDTSHYRFFVMKITWKDVLPTDTDKEVDVVYITTKGTGSSSE